MYLLHQINEIFTLCSCFCLQVVQYLAGCGLQSCVMLVNKGYPDIGWNPVEGERYLDFLRFAVFCNGKKVNAVDRSSQRSLWSAERLSRWSLQPCLVIRWKRGRECQRCGEASHSPTRMFWPRPTGWRRRRVVVSDGGSHQDLPGSLQRRPLSFVWEKQDAVRRHSHVVWCHLL